MSVPTNYSCQLKFELNHYTPDLFKSQWFYIKYLTEYGIIDNYNLIILLQFMKDNFNLESNKNLIILDRLEGGFGLSLNSCSKYFSFRLNCNDINDDYIIINIYNSQYDSWSFEELDDIIISFIKSINSFIDSNYISHSIIIKNNNLNFNINNNLNFNINNSFIKNNYLNNYNVNDNIDDNDSDTSTIKDFNIR